MTLDIAALAVFVIVHVAAGGLRFLDGTPRSRWLSFAGGLSVAYVFMHVFPELQQAQEALAEHAGIRWLDHHAWLVALIGLVGFYGLEQYVSRARARVAGASVPERRNEPNAGQADGVFWLHMASFALYNALIGYLLVHRVDDQLSGLIAYTVAMALHFIVNDHALAADHRALYHRLGRWLLVAAIVTGYALGRLIDIGAAAEHVLFALLAGGIVLNVLKEELPAERESRFGPFVAGAALYTVTALLA